MTASGFSDHFSGHADDYARYRPDYPKELFGHLSGLSPSRQRAWDCATGNGQAALALAEVFEEVVATDASSRQLEAAAPDPRIRYAVAPAEDSGLPAGSVDLVTVAQALHWFDRLRFWEEARRVLRPRGVIAVWAYDLLRVTEEIDATVLRLYRDVVGAYWPPGRTLVEAGYRKLEFPFEEIEAPPFEMEKSWTLPELVGYLRTWSATRRFVASRREDPIRVVAEDLERAWGDPRAARTVRWDLDLRVGRAGTG
ncbi:MAG: class I SAM-dependent methyltransferase [Acidobacteriota bacterium]